MNAEDLRKIHLVKNKAKIKEMLKFKVHARALIEIIKENEGRLALDYYLPTRQCSHEVPTFTRACDVFDTLGGVITFIGSFLV